MSSGDDTSHLHGLQTGLLEMMMTHEVGRMVRMVVVENAGSGQCRRRPGNFAIRCRVGSFRHSFLFFDVDIFVIFVTIDVTVDLFRRIHHGFIVFLVAGRVTTTVAARAGVVVVVDGAEGKIGRLCLVLRRLRR